MSAELQPSGKGFVLYVDENLEPVEDEQDAVLARYVAPDGVAEWYVLETVSRLEMTWNEADHPRHPSGSEQGGEFAPKDGPGAVGARIEKLTAEAKDKAKDPKHSGAFGVRSDTLNTLIYERRQTDDALSQIAEVSAESDAPLDSVARALDGQDWWQSRLVKKTKMSAQLYRASQRVHFSVIDQRTQSVADRVAPELATLVAKAVKRALGDNDNLRALTDKDVVDVAAWQLNGSDVSKLKDRFNSAMTEGWNIGAAMMMNEIERAKREAFTADQRKVKMARLADLAADYLEANSFRMAGNLRDGARAIVQQNLLASIRNTWSVEQTRANIWDSLVSKGFTDRRSVDLVEDDEAVQALLDQLDLDDEESAAHYLNTLIRTNTYEAMNEARYNEATDPELGGFVVAFEYSAILDGRTTEICQHLDDKVYKADNPLWDKYRPPNHFNCRSVLIPITEVDDWDGAESDVPAIEPQEGFG